MTYVTHVARTEVATSDGESLNISLGLTLGATLVSVGAVVATPSSSGNVPDTVSDSARLVWVGPSNVNSTGGTITPSGARASAENAGAGEALWITMTELQ